MTESSKKLAIIVLLLIGLVMTIVLCSCSSRYGCGNHGIKGKSGKYITGWKYN